MVGSAVLPGLLTLSGLCHAFLLALVLWSATAFTFRSVVSLEKSKAALQLSLLYHNHPTNHQIHVTIHTRHSLSHIATLTLISARAAARSLRHHYPCPWRTLPTRPTRPMLSRHVLSAWMKYHGVSRLSYPATPLVTAACAICSIKRLDSKLPGLRIRVAWSLSRRISSVKEWSHQLC